MNKRMLLISLFVLVVLAIAVFATIRVSALRSSGTTGNQVFYSPSIKSLIPPARAEGVRNQVFYSLFVGSLVNPVLSLSPVPSGELPEEFYSQYIKDLIRGTASLVVAPSQPGTLGSGVIHSPAFEKRIFSISASTTTIINQVFYSPTIEGFVH